MSATNPRSRHPIRPRSLESSRQYLYVPRVVDGQPVEVEGVSTLIEFDIAQ